MASKESFAHPSLARIRRNSRRFLPDGWEEMLQPPNPPCLACRPWDEGSVFSDSLRGSDVEEAVVPEGVEVLDASAFAGCRRLTRVSLLSTLRVIEESAFWGCESLSTLTLPPSLERIGSRAFSGCSALVELNIPAGVREIGSGAFANCENLTTLTLPPFLNWIGMSTFSG